MQTFLPHKSFEKSARVLDYRRLGKQRVEAWQIIRGLEGGTSMGWRNHPATLMWKGYVPALKLYFNVISEEWEERGYNHNLGYYKIGKVTMPSWLGKKKLHSSHRSALLFKNEDHYRQFNWSEEPKLDYWWPIIKKA